MRRRNTGIVLLLSIVMIFTTCLSTFAIANEPEEVSEVEETAAFFEDAVSMDAVSDDISCEDSKYVYEGESIIEIPINSDESILSTIESGETIEMGLPCEIDAGEGVLTEEGSIIYDNDENTSMCVQVLEESDGKERYISTRTMISIENADAPREYSFAFDLPTGFEIMADYDYNKKAKQELIDNKEEIIYSGVPEEEFQEIINSYDETAEEYYVVNEDGIVVQVIEAAWAIDAEGGDVHTYYELRDNKLVQIVDFDENSLFPIIADPRVNETRSFSVNISNAALGLPGVIKSSFTKSMRKQFIKAIKKTGKKKILAKIGSKFLPGVDIATSIATIAAAYNEAIGYKGFTIYGSVKYKKRENHKEGTITYGWALKSLKLKQYK